MPDVLPVKGGAAALPPKTPNKSNTASNDRGSSVDPVDQWLKENPETPEASASVDTEPTESAPVAAETTEPVATEPAPAGKVEGEAPVAKTDSTADASSETNVAAEAAPVVAAQTAPVKTAVDLNEKIAIDEGVEWTRAQIQQGLRERVAAQSESEGFREIFGMSAAEAAQNWKPVLGKLAERPERIAFIDGYLENADKAQYLEACAAHFDSETAGEAPAAPAAVPYTALPPEVQNEIAQMRQYRQARETQEAQQRFNSEMSAATAAYPVIATNEVLRQQILIRARELNTLDQRYGLPEAVQQMSRIIEAVAMADAGIPNTPAPQVAAPAATPVLASAGASPNGATSTRGSNITDPVERWLKHDARAAGFQ